MLSLLRMSGMLSARDWRLLVGGCVCGVLHKRTGDWSLSILGAAGVTWCALASLVGLYASVRRRCLVLLFFFFFFFQSKSHISPFQNAPYKAYGSSTQSANKHLRPTAFHPIHPVSSTHKIHSPPPKAFFCSHSATVFASCLRRPHPNPPQSPLSCHLASPLLRLRSPSLALPLASRHRRLPMR